MNRYKFFGQILTLIAWVLSKTLRIQVVLHPNYIKTNPYLFAFWHGKQFLPSITMRKQHKTDGAILVSSSRDGEIISTLLQNFGYETIRGSSRRDTIKATAAIVRRLKNNQSVALAIDGPIGPIYKVKPGLSRMAQKFNLEILPMGSAFSRKWVFSKAWDKLEIPKPFSKAVIYVGEPYLVPEQCDLEKINLELEEKIHAADKQAEKYL